MAGGVVFVVDDEQDNLDFMSEIIQDAGHAAMAFTDGREALAEMKKGRPDMAFLDVQMPGINGFEILKAIRGSGELEGLPVVFLSAMGAVTGEDYDPDTIEQRYGVRPDAFLAKPIDAEAVTGQLRAFVQA